MMILQESYSVIRSFFYITALMLVIEMKGYKRITYIRTMKLLISGLFIFLFMRYALCQTEARPVQGLTGKIYNEITEVKEFKGYKVVKGSALEPTEDNYCIVTIVKGKYTMLLFEKCLSIGAGSKVEYTLLDTLNLGRLKQPYDVAYSYCRINRKNDSEVVALVKRENKEYFKTILKAWRANKKTARFEQIGTTGIDCLDNGYSEVD
jgi:hypothetical protein